jgi:hypothetical protein
MTTWDVCILKPFFGLRTDSNADGSHAPRSLCCTDMTEVENSSAISQLKTPTKAAKSNELRVKTFPE